MRGLVHISVPVAQQVTGTCAGLALVRILTVVRKNLRGRWPLSIFLLLSSTLLPGQALANFLTITIENPSPVTVGFGQQVNIFATLTNSTPGEIDLNAHSLQGKGFPPVPIVEITACQTLPPSTTCQVGLQPVLLPASIAGETTVANLLLGSFGAFAGASGGPLLVTVSIDFFEPGNIAGTQTASATFQANAAAVPEPATILLLGSGLAAIAGSAWRRHPRK